MAVAIAWSAGPRSILYSLAGGAGGTGRMISEAIFHSFATFIQLMTIRNGLGVPSCPAYDTVMVIGLGQRVGLGRSAFSARFTKLVGQSMYRYLIGRRMAEAAFFLESSDDGIARIATRVGYETVAAFSKVFHRHHGLTPGRYRAARRCLGGPRDQDVLEADVVD